MARGFFLRSTKAALASALSIIACISCLSTSGDGGCGRVIAPRPCRCDPPPPAKPPHVHPAPLESETPPHYGGSVSLRISNEPGSLLSLIEPIPVVKAIIDHDVLESLVRKTPEGIIEPGLAEDWDVAHDGLRYRFRLTPDARWHDGLPVTVDDVIFTFEKMRDPENHTAFKERFDHVSNPLEVGPLEVELVLDRADPGFLGLLDSLMILPAHVYGRGVLAEHHAARAPVGSGPFRFATWSPGRYIVLERNDDWRRERPFLSEIVYRIAQDDTVALELFRRGELDVVPELVPRVATREKNARAVVATGSDMEALVFNTKKAKLRDPAVRRAIASAVDRRAIVCSLLDCAADLVDSLWKNDKFPGVSEPLEFSLPSARALLDESGWIDREDKNIRKKDGVSLDISFMLPDTARDLRRVAAVVQNDLRKIDISMKTEIVGWNRYLQRLRAGAFEAAFVTYSTGQINDVRRWFHSRSIIDGQNFSRTADAALDELIDRYEAAFDESTQRELRKAIARRLDQTRPVFFLYRPHSATLIRDNVRGIRPQGDWFEERQMWLKDAQSSDIRQED